MAKGVYNGKIGISTSHELVARTSQCVAVGIVSSATDLGGIAQIHYTTDHEITLNELIEGCMAIDDHQENYKIGVGGWC